MTEKQEEVDQGEGNLRIKLNVGREKTEKSQDGSVRKIAGQGI